MAWRMAEKCSDCPFASSGAGLRLRNSLREGRWREILSILMHDGSFTCHKTSDETGDGSNLICAGALEWQEKHGYSCQLERWMERIDAIFGKEKATNAAQSLRQAAKRSKRGERGERFYE